MPSCRVLVRLPLHVILRVEAAFPSAILLRTSERMKTNVRRVDIATCPNGRFDIHDFNGMGVEAATGR